MNKALANSYITILYNQKNNFFSQKYIEETKRQFFLWLKNDPHSLTIYKNEIVARYKQNSQYIYFLFQDGRLIQQDTYTNNSREILFNKNIDFSLFHNYNNLLIKLQRKNNHIEDEDIEKIKSKLLAHEKFFIARYQYNKAINKKTILPQYIKDLKLPLWKVFEQIKEINKKYNIVYDLCYNNYKYSTELRYNSMQNICNDPQRMKSVFDELSDNKYEQFKNNYSYIINSIKELDCQKYKYIYDFYEDLTQNLHIVYSKYKNTNVVQSLDKTFYYIFSADFLEKFIQVKNIKELKQLLNRSYFPNDINSLRQGLENCLYKQQSNFNKNVHQKLEDRIYTFYKDKQKIHTFQGDYTLSYMLTNCELCEFVIFIEELENLLKENNLQEYGEWMTILKKE